MLKSLRSGYCCVVLSGLVPAAYYASKNNSQQTIGGIIAGIAVVLTVDLAAAGGCALLFRVVRAIGAKIRGMTGMTSDSSVDRPPSHFETICLSLAVTAGLLCLSGFVVESLSTAVIAAGGIVIALGIFLLARAAGFKPLCVFLAAFCALSIFNLVSAEVGAEPGFLPPPAGIPLTYAMERKPNIYLFFMESFHGRDVINKYYEFDAPELFDRLERDGYVIYSHFYSNYIGTVKSISALLSMRHHFNRFSMNSIDTRRPGFDLLATNNVFTILKRNGYRINVIDQNDDYVFRKKSDLIDYVHFPQDLSLVENVKKFLTHLNARLGDLFDTVLTWSGREFIPSNSALTIMYRNYPEQFNLRDGPSFFYIHIGASHIREYTRFYPEPGGWPAPNQPWVEKYKEDYLDSVVHLNKYLDMIDANDPDALILIVGDHGAWKHGREVELGRDPAYLDGGKDINELFRSHGYEPDVIGEHLSSVLMAIRWPKDVVQPDVPGKGLSHVTLFPFIFRAVAGMKYDEEAFEPNISMSLIHRNGRFMVFARDGKLLKNWEVCKLVGDKLERFVP